MLLQLLLLPTTATLPQDSNPGLIHAADSAFNKRYGHTPESYVIVSIRTQQLYVIRNHAIHVQYPISSSKFGTGSKKNSNQTPLGFHVVKEKFGEDIPLYGILKSRMYTGRQAEIIHEARSVNTDDVTTRILWLSGEDKGVNLGGEVDSHERFIYIHGTPEEGLIGQPASHGCIRMLNKDVIRVYDDIPVGTKVWITNQ